MTDIASRVTALASEHFGIIGITNQTSYVDQGADSLDLVEWIMLLEESFSIEITDIQAEKVLNLQSSIDIVQQLAVP